MLTARGAVEDRVAGLNVGADDYLVKPFAMEELIARVSALLRRRDRALDVAQQLRVGDLTLDLVRHEATREGRVIELTAKEFALLEYLMRNAGRVISKTMILSHVWGYQFDPQTNVVDVLVSRLRAKLDRDFPTKLIHTLRGAGYVFKAE
jgi:two-component system OmpR family response regulator